MEKLLTVVRVTEIHHGLPLRLVGVVNAEEVEEVWQEHRNGWSPDTIEEAAKEVGRLLESRSHLLIPTPHSADLEAICARCRNTAAFPVADTSLIVSLLGYC